MQSLLQKLHRCEDLFLIGLFVITLCLAAAQIVLRNVLDAGILWIEPLLRILVLWLGLLGAAIASRDDRHIRIDLLSRFFNRSTNLLIEAGVNLFTATVCLLVAWYGTQWVYIEYLDSLTGLARIPVWIFEIIVPVAFCLIGLRHLLAFINCMLATRMQRIDNRQPSL